MRGRYLLFLVIVVALVYPSVSIKAEEIIKEVDFFPSDWCPSKNITITSIITPSIGGDISTDFRLIIDDNSTPWYHGNITKDETTLTLWAEINLLEGEYINYQFRLLLNNEEIYRGGVHSVGSDTIPPDVKFTPPQEGPYRDIPQLLLRIDPGPSSIVPHVNITMDGVSQSFLGSASLVVYSKKNFLLTNYHFPTNLISGPYLLTAVICDGAGNSAVISFNVNLQKGGGIIEGLWPEGDILREALTNKGFVVNITEKESVEEFYLCSLDNDIRLEKEVNSTKPAEGRGEKIEFSYFNEIVSTLKSGRYFWQVKGRDDKGLVVSNCNYFTLIGSLKNFPLGLPKWGREGEKIPLQPLSPLGVEPLRDIDAIPVIIENSTEEPLYSTGFRIHWGSPPFFYLPSTPSIWPIYVDFPSGEKVRVDPQIWKNNLTSLPGAPPLLRLVDEVGGIDTLTLQIKIDGDIPREVNVGKDVKVERWGKIGDINGPIAVDFPIHLMGGEMLNGVTTLYRDMLPSSPVHRIFLSPREIPPPPRVKPSREGNRLSLIVYSPGWGRINVSSVVVFNIVGRVPVPTTEGFNVSIGDEVIMTFETKEDVLIELKTERGIFFFRGEVGPENRTGNPVIEIDINRDRISLWIGDIPSFVDRVVWDIGGRHYEGKRISLPIHSVAGSKVNATLYNGTKIVEIVNGGYIPEEKSKGNSIWGIVVIYIVLLIVFLILFAYPYLSVKGKKVKQEKVRDDLMFGAPTGVRKYHPVRASLSGISTSRARLPAPTARSFTPRGGGTLTSEKIYNCAICLKPILPPEEPIKCSCGARFHKKCAERKGVCPHCGKDIMVEG